MNKGDALETTQISLTLTVKMKADLETERQKTYKRSLQEFIVDVLSDFLERRKSDLPDQFSMEKKDGGTENMSCKLENRPRFMSEKYGKLIEKVGAKEAFRLYSIEVYQWFAGFERRQRQNLADYEKALETKKNWDKEFLACWKAISNYIKLEVLGVEPQIKGETEK